VGVPARRGHVQRPAPFVVLALGEGCPPEFEEQEDALRVSPLHCDVQCRAPLPVLSFEVYPSKVDEDGGRIDVASLHRSVEHRLAVLVHHVRIHLPLGLRPQEFDARSV